MLTDFLPPSVTQIKDPEAIFLLQHLHRRSLQVDVKLSNTERSQSSWIATAYLHSASPSSSTSPILLLPGFDSSLLEFRRLIPLLAKHHEIWAVDPLGFGFTESTSTFPINPSTIRQHLLNVVTTWIQEPVTLVGASLGGAVAIDFALHYPDQVRSLILLDSVGFSGSFPMGQFLPRFVINFGADWLNLRKRVALTVTSMLPTIDPMLVDALRCSLLHQEMPGWKAAISAFTESGGYAELGDRIAEINHPTLILWGDRDDVLGTQDANRFATAITGSQLIWIKQAGHAPHFDQAPQVATHILTFCQN